MKVHMGGGPARTFGAALVTSSTRVRKWDAPFLRTARDFVQYQENYLEK